MSTGRVQKRGADFERAWISVFRESGVHVPYASRYSGSCKQMLAHLNIAGVGANDQRQLDFIASGLHIYSGKVLCCDTTMVSAVDSSGNPHSRTSAVPGICLERATARKVEHYSEVVQSANAHLLVLACEKKNRRLL